MAVNTKDLIKYANSGLNVLLSGPHGIGKTAIIKEVFNNAFGEYYTNWRYFSASTLDPWVDFIGIPKNYTRPDGKEVFGIVPPEHFTGEEDVKAIFFDEINRAEEKTLNALMELIQFGSINGRKFPNLKCIWAAENPADDQDNQYMVKELDPAQKDRFQIQIPLKNELNMAYMRKKFGQDASQIAAEWWNGYKTQISPRRLDDILSGFFQGFNLSHYVPANVNANALQKSLNAINELASIKSIIESGTESIKDFFTIDKVISLSSIFKTYPDIAIKVSEHVDKEIVSKVSSFSTKDTQIKINEMLQEKELFGFKKPNKKKSNVSDFEEESSAVADFKRQDIDIDINIKELSFVRVNDRTKFQDEFYAYIVNFNSKVNNEICKHKIMKKLRVAFPSFVNTYYFQKFIDFVDSSNNNTEKQVEFFMKFLATAIVFHKGKEATAFFAKMIKCKVFRERFKINPKVASDVLSFVQNTKSSLPDINNLIMI